LSDIFLENKDKEKLLESINKAKEAGKFWLYLKYIWPKNCRKNWFFIM